jgi:hypothetical protein
MAPVRLVEPADQVIEPVVEGVEHYDLLFPFKDMVNLSRLAGEYVDHLMDRDTTRRCLHYQTSRGQIQAARQKHRRLAVNVDEMCGHEKQIPLGAGLFKKHPKTSHQQI